LGHYGAIAPLMVRIFSKQQPSQPAVRRAAIGMQFARAGRQNNICTQAIME
jgi:hypothetical protein